MEDSGTSHHQKCARAKIPRGHNYTDANGVYDPLGRIRREVDSQVPPRTHAFAYDSLSQLVAESHPDFGTYLYTYDKAGNRTSKEAIGPASYTDYYGVNTAMNRLEWVNRNTNAAPTSGQANPYTRLVYDGYGRLIQRDGRTDPCSAPRLYLTTSSTTRIERGRRMKQR